MSIGDGEPDPAIPLTPPRRHVKSLGVRIPDTNTRAGHPIHPPYAMYWLITCYTMMHIFVILIIPEVSFLATKYYHH